MEEQPTAEQQATTPARQAYKKRSPLRPPPRHDEMSGLDDWLMTYADMITLLLCFFALILSVSVPKKEMFEQARERVLEKFAGSEDQVIILSSDKEHLGQSEKDHPFDAQPSIVDRFKMDENVIWKDGKIQATQEKKRDGSRIDIIDIPSTAFFASGSAQLSDEGKEILTDILNEHLTVQERSDYQITIEGHTDDAPINTAQFPSNWELSTARAASVVRYLIEQGIKPERLRAAGYADTFPKVPNRTEAGIIIPDNQAQNRRVLIKLEKIEDLE